MDQHGLDARRDERNGNGKRQAECISSKQEVDDTKARRTDGKVLRRGDIDDKSIPLAWKFLAEVMNMRAMAMEKDQKMHRAVLMADDMLRHKIQDPFSRSSSATDSGEESSDTDHPHLCAAHQEQKKKKEIKKEWKCLTNALRDRATRIEESLKVRTVTLEATKKLRLLIEGVPVQLSDTPFRLNEMSVKEDEASTQSTETSTLPNEAPSSKWEELEQRIAVQGQWYKKVEWSIAAQKQRCEALEQITKAQSKRYNMIRAYHTQANLLQGYRNRSSKHEL